MTGFNNAESLAVKACQRVKADAPTGEERLRLALEAGRALLAVPRKPGARTDLVKRIDEAEP